MTRWTVAENDKWKLWLDTMVKTPVKIKYNRPDIVLVDKRLNQAVIIEQEFEFLNFQKYGNLVNEIQVIYIIKTINIIPLIFTWEGVANRNMLKFAKYLGLSKREIGYIQSRILKSTLESLTLSERKGCDEKIALKDTSKPINNLFQTVDH